MSNALALIRSLIIYGLCLPLAIYLGYLVANDVSMATIAIMAVVLFLPLVPALLKWHHFLLFACWNTSAILFFLPGRPNLWLVMTAVSFILSILQHTLNRNVKFLSVPSVARPLIFLAVVIFVTANLTGGFGLRSLGGDVIGGKRYFLLFGAILGYFAMACYPAMESRTTAYAAVYLLGGVTSVIGNLAPYVDKVFFPIFAVFPVENLQDLYGNSAATEPGARLGGLTFACLAVFCFLLARHGVRGMFGLGDGFHFLPFRLRGGFGITHPSRIPLFLVMIWGALLGGYRSVAILLALTF